MRHPAHSVLKRWFDVAFAACALAIASPVLVVAALCARLGDRGPLLFRQERIGLRGLPFELLKFRTMRQHEYTVEQLGQVRPDHPLVTPVGRFMRRFKIDELPQLWNVVRGDMSIVGPRPTIREQVERYDAFRRRRLEARPGVTGWAQVKGSSEIPWDDRIMLDVWYIEHWSFGIDLRILLRTPAVVLLGERPDSAALDDARRHAERLGWTRS
jgi:lipopolysaccharide/colanic/teichoic acid biosynthesis glycosyltransferase